MNSKKLKVPFYDRTDEKFLDLLKNTLASRKKKLFLSNRRRKSSLRWIPLMCHSQLKHSAKKDEKLIRSKPFRRS